MQDIGLYRQYIVPIVVGVTIAVVLGIFNWVINTDRFVTKLKGDNITIEFRISTVEKKVDESAKSTEELSKKVWKLENK